MALSPSFKSRHKLTLKPSMKQDPSLNGTIFVLSTFRVDILMDSQMEEIAKS